MAKLYKYTCKLSKSVEKLSDKGVSISGVPIEDKMPHC